LSAVTLFAPQTRDDLLAVRFAVSPTTARHGHEIRYRRTELGSALLYARRG
jgi:hypothetical protein